jgi:hypothetical protein
VILTGLPLTSSRCSLCNFGSNSAKSMTDAFFGFVQSCNPVVHLNCAADSTVFSYLRNYLLIGFFLTIIKFFGTQFQYTVFLAICDPSERPLLII